MLTKTHKTIFCAQTTRESIRAGQEWDLFRLTECGSDCTQFVFVYLSWQPNEAKHRPQKLANLEGYKNKANSSEYFFQLRWNSVSRSGFHSWSEFMARATNEQAQRLQTI